MTNPLDDTRNPYIIRIRTNPKDPNSQPFPNLYGDFSDWKEYLKGKPFGVFVAETRKEFNLPPQPSTKRIGKIPKYDGYNFSVFDTHADKWSVDKGISMWLEDVVQGRRANLTFHGDDSDALPEYHNDESVIKPLTDIEAQKMHANNLAFKNEKGFMILSYPDNSVKNLGKKIILRRAFPELCNFVIGDHELPLLYPEFKIFKDEFELSNNVRNRLTEEERAFVKTELSAMPLYVVTENGFLLCHTLSPSSTKNQLEQLVYDANGKSALEDALFGEEAHDKECKGERFKQVRIYDQRKIAAFLKEMKAKHALIGHTGIADFIYRDENGDERPILGGILDYSREFSDFTIGATTEHRNAGKSRSGIDRMGPNEDGIYCTLKLDTEPDRLNFGKLGQGTLPHYLPKKKVMLFKKEETIKNEIVSELVKAVQELTAKGGFAEKYAKNIEYASSLLEQDIKTGERNREIVEETIKAFKENDAKGIGEYLESAPEDKALYFIPKEMRCYFNVKTTIRE
ncbi:MAG: hypothetical protein AABW88_00295 [Nanoarchaeota archaeon]